MEVRRALLDVTPLRTSRRFRRLWAGWALSAYGSQLTLVAVVFQVWRATGSTVWSGAVGLAQAAPLIAFGLFAGSMIDRGDRRRLYLIATVGRGACSLPLALPHLPVPGMLLLVAAQSCFGAVAGPASRTFIPRLLPEAQVAAGLAVNRIAFQAVLLLGPASGGLLVGWLGAQVCYLVDAATFALAFAGAYGLPPMRADGAPRPGLGFLVSSRMVRGALLTDLAATVLAMPVSLFPLVNAERFGGDPRTLGLFLSAIAAGGVLASALSGAFTRLPAHGPVMLAGSTGWGVSLALFGVSPNRWLGLGFLVLAGAADTVAVVSRGAIVQRHTPDALLGRVVAAEQVVGVAGPDVGNMRAGLLAAATSGSAALAGGGLLCVAAVALVGAATPELRRLGPTPRSGRRG